MGSRDVEAPVLGSAHKSGAQPAGPWGVDLETLSSISEVGRGPRDGRDSTRLRLVRARSAASDPNTAAPLTAA